MDQEKIFVITFDADYNKTVFGREVEFSKYTAYQLRRQLGILPSQLIMISITEGRYSTRFHLSLSRSRAQLGNFSVSYQEASK